MIEEFLERMPHIDELLEKLTKDMKMLNLDEIRSAIKSLAY